MTGLALLTELEIKPLACSRFRVSQSKPFQALAPSCRVRYRSARTAHRFCRYESPWLATCVVRLSYCGGGNFRCLAEVNRHFRFADVKLEGECNPPDLSRRMSGAAGWPGRRRHGTVIYATAGSKEYDIKLVKQA